MKIKNFTPQYFSLFPFLLLLIFTVSCQHNNGRNDKLIEINEEETKEATDFIGATEYEFNMLKNPTTGLIPEGIREQELAQARSILLKQQSGNTAGLLNSYSFQGPNNLGGRTRSIAYDVRFNGTSNQVIIAGGISGGIFKSTDNGATWVRKSPTGQHFSCTSIAQDPRAGSQDIWYYTVGEASGNSTSGSGAFYSGNGVYKSIDNGETWTRQANSNTTALETFSTNADFISKVVVDPTNGNVYIACSAAILRSTDGGGTWNSVLSGTLSSTTNHTDIVVTTGGRFYAGFGGQNSVGADGVWTSISGAAASWTRIGLPGTPATWQANGTYGRVVLAIAPSNQNTIYAMYWNGTSFNCGTPGVEADFFKLDMTVPATPVWTDRSAFLPDEAGCLQGNDPFAVQGGYDLVIAVKPDDENCVFIGGTNAYRSTNGFASAAATTRIGGYVSSGSYGLYTNSHSDIHAFAFQPGSSTTMICTNDGGIQRTANNLAATVAWTQINTGYRTYQYYYVALDPRLGNTKVIGGAQDNGTTRNVGGAGTSYESVFSGDGVSVGLSDVVGGNTFEYVGSQLGQIASRNSVLAANFGTDITPPGESGTGLFVTLFYLDPDNSQRLYYANDNALYRTTSASTVTSGTWTNMTGVGTSVGAANDITALATTRRTYSAATSSLFMGTSNGRVYRLDDPTGVAAATAPVDITGGAFPAGAYVSSIAVNPRNDDTVLVTFSNYGVTGNVWWTGNANSATPTWVNVEDNLTLPSFRSSAIITTSTGVEYYVGTSTGLYGATINAALPANTDWALEGASDMGFAVITDLKLRPSDNRLLIGTHGYGMWGTFLSTPLPVTLLSFSGKLQGKNVLLEWSTTAETNSKEFQIERSTDGISFRKLGSVPAAGTSSSTRNYSYLDIEATEVNYYRLKMVDIDGQNKISNTVIIKNPGLTQNISAVNNPFADFINIRFEKMPKGKVTLSLTDMSGKRIAAYEYYQTASSILRFDNYPKTLARGIYILQAEAQGKKYSVKLMKQ